MAMLLAEKEFGYVPPSFDMDYVNALSIYSTRRQNETGERFALSSSQRRRKRSLALLTLCPDMSAIRVMMALKIHLRDYYGVWYDGRQNHFKWSFDNEKMCRLLGFMETISRVFVNRNVELDLVLRRQNQKEVKIAHSIRDRGEFDAELYEEGREEAYRLMVLAMPQRKRFSIWDEQPVVEDAEAA